MIYLKESILNLLENKRSSLVFFIFLTLSFTGIITIDSMIYSVSKKAETELKIHGENVITIKLPESVSIDFLKKMFSDSKYRVSFSKRFHMRIAGTPFSENVDGVLGVELSKVKRLLGDGYKNFSGNRVIISSDSQYADREYIFINGIPFKVVGVIRKKKTEFLDSLGLSANASDSKYLIPLNTLNRLTLQNTANYVELLKKNEVWDSDIAEVNKVLCAKNIKNFSINSVLDVKETVNKVMNRFSLLTDFVYILLASISVIVICAACRRNFQLRGVEFALKIIHGVDKKFMIRIVMLETLLITLLSLFTSLVLCLMILATLIKLLNAELSLRLTMSGFALFLITGVCCITSNLSGKAFFRKSPVDILKKTIL